MKSKISKNKGILIAIIKKQSNEIIAEIKNKVSSENLQKIKLWTNQINPDVLPSDDISLLATIIDTIHLYFKKESSQEDKYLIESCLCNLISEWGHLSNEKIARSIFRLKAYIKTNDVDIKYELKEFNSLSKFKKNSENKEKVKRKKIKPRIIIFDEDNGIGYDNCSSHWYFKEVKRLSKISLEIDPSPRMRFKEEFDRLGKIYINEGSSSKKLQKEIAELEFQLFADEKEARCAADETKRRNIQESIKKTTQIRDYHRNWQKSVSKAEKINVLLNPIVSHIKREIDQTRESFNNDKFSLNLKLPNFQAIENSFYNAYLASINYDQLKELIYYAQSVFIAIDKMQKTLNKVDVFFKSLDFTFQDINLNNFKKRMIEVFNNNEILNFFETSLNLYQRRTLNLHNNYCLLNMKEQKKIKFSEPNFLDKFISKNAPDAIFEFLSKNIPQFFNLDKKSQKLIRNRNFEKNDNIFKKLFNFLSGKYYFLNQNHKNKFVKNFFLNFCESPNFKLIKIKMLKLKWWHFILMGLNPYCVFKKDFKENLSRNFFLYLIEEEFNKIDQKPNLKNIDALYSIYDRLKSADIRNKNDAILLSFLNISHSRKALIKKLTDCNEIKKLLEKSADLAESATYCINEFTKLLNACQTESKKILPYGDLSNKLFFKNNLIKRTDFSINNMGNFSSSYVRSIN